MLSSAGLCSRPNGISIRNGMTWSGACRIISPTASARKASASSASPPMVLKVGRVRTQQRPTGQTEGYHPLIPKNQTFLRGSMEPSRSKARCRRPGLGSDGSWSRLRRVSTCELRPADDLAESEGRSSGRAEEAIVGTTSETGRRPQGGKRCAVLSAHLSGDRRRRQSRRPSLAFATKIHAMYFREPYSKRLAFSARLRAR